MKSELADGEAKPKLGLFGRTIEQPAQKAAVDIAVDDAPWEAMGIDSDSYDFMRYRNLMASEGLNISPTPWVDLDVTRDEFGKIEDSYDNEAAAGPLDIQSVISRITINQNRRNARQGGAIQIDRRY